MGCPDRDVIDADRGRILCSRSDGRSLAFGHATGNTRILVRKWDFGVAARVYYIYVVL
jgi:hypothetical protein